jgi:DNA-binding response OmpR family regulator
MGAVAKSPISQWMTAEAGQVPKVLLNDSLKTMRIMDLKEVGPVSQLVPVIVLMPAPSAKSKGDPISGAANNSRVEASETSQLLELFGKAMRRSRSESTEGELVFGDVSVNFSCMEASRKGRPVKLTAMEFKTLKYLVQNTRRVISRDELLNEVWGYENYPCTRTVDNHILRLRQKLERDPSQPIHFRTVHRAGYKFLP